MNDDIDFQVAYDAVVEVLWDFWKEQSSMPLAEAARMLVAKNHQYREALEQIAATTPKMNLGGEMVDVPIHDMWDAQKIAHTAINKE